MMPITMVDPGKECTVIKVGGQGAVKRHLADLGFTEGAVVSIVQRDGGNLIVNVRNSKLAITSQMASKILVHI